jgi:hypothetical protein
LQLYSLLRFCYSAARIKQLSYGNRRNGNPAIFIYSVFSESHILRLYDTDDYFRFALQ